MDVKIEMSDINANFKTCSDSASDSGAEMCDKDTVFDGDLDVKKSGKKGKHTPQVTRRNERERNRVKHINKTFHILRQHLPTKKPNRKMSKVETLRMAVEYIRCMKDMISEHDRMSTPFGMDNQPFPGFTVHPGLTTNNGLLQGSNGFNLSNNAMINHPNSNILSNNGFLAPNAGLNANIFQNPGLFMYSGLYNQQGLRNTPAPSSPVSLASSPSPTYSSDSSYEGVNSEHMNRISRNGMDLAADLW